MKPDYKHLDQAILSKVKSGCNRMMLLENNEELVKLAKPFCVKPFKGFAPAPFRVIDRRLQALRKKGLLRFNGKCWEVVEGGAA